MVKVGGVDVVEIAERYGTPAYVVDEADFRARAREYAEAFDAAFADLCGGADVYYAGKAFLCDGGRPLGGRGGAVARHLLGR